MKTRLITFSVLIITIAILAGVQMNAMGADIDWSDLFLPIVIRNAQAITAPSGTLYVFNTTAKMDGYAGGRVGMGALCAAQDPESHFCTRQEIEHSMETLGVVFSDPFTKSWLDDPVGIEWLEGFSCSGWTSNGSTDLHYHRGTVIDYSAWRYTNVWCSEVIPAVCCKRIP